MQNKQDNGHYTPINGLNIYYELHGAGNPLVLLHGGGSTIQSTYGRILPKLVETHRIIAIELQAHGHTADIDRPLSFEQDADDVAALLNYLDIPKADIMGFSNGATTALQVAIRHPQLVSKLVLVAALYKRSGMMNGFWDGMQLATLDNMPPQLKEAYHIANSDPGGLQAMFDRDKARMLDFKDISDEAVQSVKSPALVINGDADVIKTEHAFELAKTLPHAKLAILPGVHGECIGEVCTPHPESKVPDMTAMLIDEFLKTPVAPV